MPQIKPSNPIIDWGNPITKGLVFDAPFYEGAGLKPKELVTGNEFAMSGSTWKKGLYGNSLHIDGTNTNQKATLTSKSIQDGIDKISIQIISRNSENASRVIDKRGASFRFAVIYGGAPDYRMIFYAGFSGSTPNWATPNNSWAIGDAHNFVATYDFTSTSNDPLLYMDGAQTTVTEVVAPSGSANADGSTITIGNRPASDVGNNQDVFLVRYWNRILTPTEIKLLSSDPWCIYQKPRFNIINSISSAVTGLRGLISFGMIPFGVAEAPAGPKSRSITIDHTKVGSSTHTDFPVLIAGTYAYLATEANGGNVKNANGYDITFYSDSALTTPLKFQRVSWNATTGECQFRVKIASLSNSSDTVIYMAYGDSSITTDQQDPTNTWNGNFEYVGNLEGDSSDSSSNNYDGTDTSITYGTSYGKYGQGANLATSGNKISLGDQTNLHSTAITYTIWYKPSSFPNAYNCIMGSEASTNVQYNTFYVKSSGKLAAYLYNVTSFDESGSTTLSTGTWYMLTLTYDSTNGMKAYVNTTVDKSNAANGNLDMGGVAMIGTQNNYLTTRDIRGDIDMPRFMSVAVSGDWVTAQYNNENSPSTFYTISAEL